MKAIKGLAQARDGAGARKWSSTAATPRRSPAVGEFLLEGLYVNNRLSKYNAKGKTFFKK